MSVRGITLVRGSIVVLDLDGTLVYVEDVQPTGARVVALPDQLPTRKEGAIFTPGRVGSKVISPYSSASRVVDVSELTARNADFIGTFEQLRAKHGPNFVQRTPEEEAAMSVIKAKQADAPKVHKGGRGAKKTPEERRARRAQRKAGKTPCVKCGLLPVHANHNGGSCEYEAPAAPAGRAPREPKDSSEPKTGRTFKLTSNDLAALQAENDKFAVGNRFFRVFKALESLPDSTGTLAQVIGAVLLDNGKPMTNPEKVARRALKAMVDNGNAAQV